jgi:threonyl-tRNA synthetase
VQKRVPVVIIIGDKEKESFEVTMRYRDVKEQTTIRVVDAVHKLRKLNHAK